MKKILNIILFTLLLNSSCFSWDYNEHKELGDAAFLMTMKKLMVGGSFSNESEAAMFFDKFFQVKYDTQTNKYFFFNLSHDDNIITYGTLNALSGDHSDNPLDINEFLRYRSSVINKIVKLQSEYSSNYETGAANMDVLGKDFNYLLLALTDLSHFHDYGKPFAVQIGEFNKNLILKLQKPFNADSVMSELKKTNSINKYISMHTFAVYLAEKAGTLFKENVLKSRELLYYALIFNSFADHFLEDLYASGHLVVNRSLMSGVIDNRALHDFYNKEGLDVANLRGETWKQYGDGTLNSRFSYWKTKSDYSDIEYSDYSEDTKRVIESVSESISDLFVAFNKAEEGKIIKSVFDRIPNDQQKLHEFFLAEYKSLSYVPIPFNTDLTGYKFPQEDIEQLKKNTQLLPNWSFIKSRVANAISLGLSTISGDVRWREYDLRLSFGSAFYSYNYNYKGTKTWTVDKWFGNTISFSLLKGYQYELGAEANVWAHILKGGFSYNFDFWVSQTRFLGIYGYIEGGWFRIHSYPYTVLNEFGQYEKSQQEAKNYFLFSPSIGVQLGSLIGINYYEWPIWLRVPLQFILPLKFRYSAKILADFKPEYQFIFELDLVF